MSQQTIVITGASDGIGAAAARQLSANGAHVVLVGRSRAKTAAVAAELQAPYHLADFAELEQVRALAAELATAHPRIDVLANNAGGIMGPRDVTRDGFEKTFQVNHLAPFLLTYLLLPTLAPSSAKVLATSSAAAKLWGKIDLEDLQLERAYSPEKAYGNAKLANILFTRELHRRYAKHGIAAAAFHPGTGATNFASDHLPHPLHQPLAAQACARQDSGQGRPRAGLARAGDAVHHLAARRLPRQEQARVLRRASRRQRPRTTAVGPKRGVVATAGRRGQPDISGVGLGDPCISTWASSVCRLVDGQLRQKRRSLRQVCGGARFRSTSALSTGEELSTSKHGVASTP